MYSKLHRTSIDKGYCCWRLSARTWNQRTAMHYAARNGRQEALPFFQGARRASMGIPSSTLSVICGNLMWWFQVQSISKYSNILGLVKRDERMRLMQFSVCRGIFSLRFAAGFWRSELTPTPKRGTRCAERKTFKVKEVKKVQKHLSTFFGKKYKEIVLIEIEI